MPLLLRILCFGGSALASVVSLPDNPQHVAQIQDDAVVIALNLIGVAYGSCLSSTRAKSPTFLPAGSPLARNGDSFIFK